MKKGIELYDVLYIAFCILIFGFFMVLIISVEFLRNLFLLFLTTLFFLFLGNRFRNKWFDSDNEEIEHNRKTRDELRKYDKENR